MRQTQEQPTREKALVEVLVVTKKFEQGGQPERRIGRFIKSQSLGRRRVTFVVRHTRTMSDHYIHIIPAKPGVVPDEAKQQAAVSYFRSIAPQASEVSSSVSDHLEFVHCGGNFGKICCPSC